MQKSKIIGIVILGLGLVLSLALLFCLENCMSVTFWVTFGFVIIAFISSLFFQMLVWKDKDSVDNQFLSIPAMVVSTSYILIQITICIIFALGSSTISTKVAVLVNTVILVVAWIINLFSIAGNDHIKKINGRQKNHHTEL